MKKGSSKNGKKKAVSQVPATKQASPAPHPTNKDCAVNANATESKGGLLNLNGKVADKSTAVLEKINKYNEEYLSGLLEDDLLLDDNLRKLMPSRLEALQRELDILEKETFIKRRSELIAAGAGGHFEANDALLASVDAKANQTQSSLGSLRARLTEMHQKLMAKQQTPAQLPLKANPRIQLPSRVKIDEFPAEGEGYDDESDLDGVDDYFDSAFDSDDELVNDLTAGVMYGGGLIDMKQIISAAQKDVGKASTMEGYDIVTKAESELQSILSIFSSPNLSLDEKLESVQPKLREAIEQDLYWRTQADKANRRIQDLRLQKRLSEMERDRLRAINGRLEGFCKDLQSENRKMKIEASKVEEAMQAAMELASDPSKNIPSAASPPPISSSVNSNGKKGKKTQKPLNANSQPSSVPSSNLFPLPELPSRDILTMEDKEFLVDRLFGLADVYQTRETHFASILEGHEIESKMCDAKIAQQQILLEKTIGKLELGESRVNELARNEAELKAQVRQYVEKFRQVEETLVKSNELFGTFRGEMEQMSVKLGRFERENHQMQTKCHTLSRNIIEMAEERNRLTGTIESLKAQKAKLEQLCRTLQAERNAARSEAKTEGSPGESGPVHSAGETTESSK